MLVASPGSHSWSVAPLGHDHPHPHPPASGSIPDISELTLRLSKCSKARGADVGADLGPVFSHFLP